MSKSQETIEYLNDIGYEKVQFAGGQWWGIPQGCVIPIPIPHDELPRSQITLRDFMFRIQRMLEVFLHKILDLILKE